MQSPVIAFGWDITKPPGYEHTWCIQSLFVICFCMLIQQTRNLKVAERDHTSWHGGEHTIQHNLLFICASSNSKWSTWTFHIISIQLRTTQIMNIQKWWITHSLKRSLTPSLRWAYHWAKSALWGCPHSSPSSCPPSDLDSHCSASADLWWSHCRSPESCISHCTAPGLVPAPPASHVKDVQCKHEMTAVITKKILLLLLCKRKGNRLCFLALIREKATCTPRARSVQLPWPCPCSNSISYQRCAMSARQ